MHEKSAPQTNFKAISWHPQKNRQTAFSQVSRPSEFPPKPAGFGYLKAVWLEIFGAVFCGFPAEIDPPGYPYIAGARPAHQNARKISPADQF